MKKTKKKSKPNKKKSNAKRAGTKKTAAAKRKSSKSPSKKKVKVKKSAKKALSKKQKKKVPAKKASSVTAKKTKKAASTNKPLKKVKQSETKVDSTTAPVKARGRPRKKGTVKNKAIQNLALEKLARKQKHTPAIFKLPSKKHTPIVFSLEEVRDVLKYRQDEPKTDLKSKSKTKGKKPKKGIDLIKKKTTVKVRAKTKNRKVGAASLTDILGFNPAQKGKKKSEDLEPSAKVPKKFQKYYSMLLDLREHVQSGLDLHTQDTLKRSAKDDTGDLSSYSQHMADAGTDNFDRDFALSLVSNEQDALYEINEAIERILNGTYGICEITGQQIKRERLAAVPFTRFSVQGQVEYEKNNHKSVQRGGLFIDSNVENTAQFTNEDTED